MRALEHQLRQPFADALAVLGLHVDESAAVLRARPGVCTLKVQGAVLKVFAPSQSDYWIREATAVRQLAGSDLAPELVGVGDHWVATTSLDLVTSLSQAPSTTPMHNALGTMLARLHAVNPGALAPLSMAERLDHWLHHHPAVECPPPLARAIEKMLVALVPLYRTSHFVHGDYGDANVLAPHGDPHRILKVIDFEGARLGDPAEDFKWTLAQGGPPWRAFASMAAAYAAAGGDLGPNASERLVLAATEWCLDLLTWQAEFANSQFRQGALAALEGFVSRDWPSAP